MMRFCPFGSTKIGATPLDTPSTMPTRLLSIPRAAKFFTVASPKRSFPNFATITTCAPHNRAATAWLAPLPPNPRLKLVPKIVSPPRGNASANVVKSTFALPTTAIRGLAPMDSPSFFSPTLLTGFPGQTAKLYHEPVVAMSNCPKGRRVQCPASQPSRPFNAERPRGRLPAQPLERASFAQGSESDSGTRRKSGREYPVSQHRSGNVPDGFPAGSTG